MCWEQMRAARDWQDDWLTVSAEGTAGVIVLPSKLLSVAVKRINSHRRRSFFWRLLFLFRIYFFNNLRGQITEPRRGLRTGRSQDKRRGGVVRVPFSSRWEKRAVLLCYEMLHSYKAFTIYLLTEGQIAATISLCCVRFPASLCSLSLRLAR